MFWRWGDKLVRWDTTKVAPTPSLPQRMRLPRSEILSTSAKTEKFEKRPGYRSPTYSLEQEIPFWKSFCKYSSPGARVGLWFEMSVFCFLGNKKTNSYKPEFQFQVIYTTGKAFLISATLTIDSLSQNRLYQWRSVARYGSSFELFVSIVHLVFYGEKKVAFRRSNFVVPEV